MFSPVDPASITKYHVNEGQIRLLTLTIVIPLAAIWLTALYGSLRFRNYAKVVESTKEGIAFKHISEGLIILAFSLPASALVGSIVSYLILKHPALLSASTIIRNYVNLLLPSGGILFINRGSSELVATLRKIRPVTWPNFTLVFIIAISCIYTWLITTRSFDAARDTGYFLPNWIILLSLAIPYLYVWCRGSLASYKLFVYKKNIRGVVYKKSLDNLAKGIAIIIVISVLSQLLVTLSARVNRLNLTPFLSIIYALVSLYALGYGLVARGSKKLKQIEEV